MIACVNANIPRVIRGNLHRAAPMGRRFEVALLLVGVSLFAYIAGRHAPRQSVRVATDAPPKAFTVCGGVPPVVSAPRALASLLWDRQTP